MIASKATAEITEFEECVNVYLDYAHDFKSSEYAYGSLSTEQLLMENLVKTMRVSGTFKHFQSN